MRKKIQRIRKAKYYFYKYGIHKILPYSKLSFLAHLGHLSAWISKNKDLPFSDFPTKNFDYANRHLLWEHLLANELESEAIDYMEFGVSKGVSFRWWMDRVKHPEAAFYGFDTFTGLPEDWGPFKKGDMANGDKPPEIDDTRHEFFQGIFQDTLPKFLQNYKTGKRKIVHLDADLYSSTLYVLTSISPYLQKGDILMFDEFNVPMHEYKAFQEWVESYYIEYEVIGEVNNYYQMALKIK